LLVPSLSAAIETDTLVPEAGFANASLEQVQAAGEQIDECQQHGQPAAKAARTNDNGLTLSRHAARLARVA